MRGLAMAAALVCAAPALAEAPTVQVVCVADAAGERGERVTVFIHVEPDRRRVASYASWFPPLLSESGAGGLGQPDISLLIGYDTVTQSGLGKPNEFAQILVQALSPLRERIPSAKLQARLAVLTGEARFDGGATVKFGLGLPGPAHSDLPGTAVRTAELALPSAFPNEVELQLLDKQHKPVNTIRYATGHSASRDALFTKAWTEADAKAADLSTCEPTGGGADYAGVPSG